MVPIAAHAYQLTETSDGQITRWSSPRVRYALAETSTIVGAGAATRAAFDQWSMTSSSSFQGEWTGTATSASGRVLVSALPPDLSFGAALAITVSQYRTGSGEITGVDLHLNVRQHRFDGSPGAFDAQSVLLHEAGHALGLDHTCGIDGRTEPSCFDLDDLSARERAAILNAVMAPSLPAGQERRTLSEDDQAGEIALYPGQRGAAPRLGEITPSCPERLWRIAVEPADRVEISLRLDDATTRPARVVERGQGQVTIEPFDGVADVVAHDPITGGTAARVAVALSALGCEVNEGGIQPPVDAGGCDCTTIGVEPWLILLALRRRGR